MTDMLPLVWRQLGTRQLLQVVRDDLGWAGWTLATSNDGRERLEGPCPDGCGKCAHEVDGAYMYVRSEDGPPIVNCKHKKSCGFKESLFRLLESKLGSPKAAADRLKARAAYLTPSTPHPRRRRAGAAAASSSRAARALSTGCVFTCAQELDPAVVAPRLVATHLLACSLIRELQARHMRVHANGSLEVVVPQEVHGARDALTAAWRAVHSALEIDLRTAVVQVEKSLPPLHGFELVREAEWAKVVEIIRCVPTDVLETERKLAELF